MKFGKVDEFLDHRFVLFVDEGFLTIIFVGDVVLNSLMTLGELSQWDDENVVFHVTPTQNVPSIVRGGLVSSFGPRSSKAETEPGVFCFINADSTMLHAGFETGWLSRWTGYVPLSVFVVNVNGLSRWDRSTNHWEWATKDSISASRLRLVGKFLE